MREVEWGIVKAMEGSRGACEELYCRTSQIIVEWVWALRGVLFYLRGLGLHA